MKRGLLCLHGKQATAGCHDARSVHFFPVPQAWQQCNTRAGNRTRPGLNMNSHFGKATYNYQASVVSVLKTLGSSSPVLAMLWKKTGVCLDSGHPGSVLHFSQCTQIRSQLDPPFQCFLSLSPATLCALHPPKFLSELCLSS